MPFSRNITDKLINDLKSQSLFLKHIKADLDNDVFPAIRKERMDFYHAGGKLFKFDKNGFETNIKFASVIDKSTGYINEDDLKSLSLIPNFEKGYPRIKENCSKYSGPEDKCISELYSSYSYLNKDTNIVVLDIEVSFESVDPYKNQDRIDILLYDKDKGILQFVEAKHFSNNELYTKPIPDVIDQINRYERQIINRKKEIVAQYKNYIKDINKIFNINLNPPVSVEEKVILLVMGFDQNQTTKLIKDIKNNDHYRGIKYYQKGHPKSLKIANLWKEAKTIA